MEFVAAAGELGAVHNAPRAPWPVAVGRTMRTASEAYACGRRFIAAGDREGRSRAQRAERLQEGCARLAQRMRLRLTVQGELPDAPCVVVANHMSYLDPIAIGQALPLTAIAKAEIASWPALGRTLDELGIVFVDRGNARSGAVALRRAMRALRAGLPILVFPEGTTTIGDEVRPFSRGAFGIARLMRVPVVPVTLRYEHIDACWVGSAALLPHLLKLHTHDEVRAEAIFGPRLQPMAFASASALAEATRQCVRSLVLP